MKSEVCKWLQPRFGIFFGYVINVPVGANACAALAVSCAAERMATNMRAQTMGTGAFVGELRGSAPLHDSLQSSVKDVD